jgi:hypothetical protein
MSGQLTKRMAPQMSAFFDDGPNKHHTNTEDCDASRIEAIIAMSDV